MRRTYDESCAELQRTGLLEPGQAPPIPDRQPRYDDPEPLGVSFFRTRVHGDLSRMTLPRTFFCRSEVVQASFRGSDLSESSFCWCDFTDVDFSDASLRASDLRASNFENVNFSKADMRGADLRRSSFVNCNFAGSALGGAKLTRLQATQLKFTPLQLAEVNWQDTDGVMPGGG